MALEDASILARALDDTDTVSLGLTKYETTRKRRATAVQKLSARNGRVFHLSRPTLRLLSQTILRIVGFVAPGSLERRFDWIYTYNATSETKMDFRINPISIGY
jgi:salicylate hydroxylase